MQLKSETITWCRSERLTIAPVRSSRHVISIRDVGDNTLWSASKMLHVNEGKRCDLNWMEQVIITALSEMQQMQNLLLYILCRNASFIGRNNVLECEHQVHPATTVRLPAACSCDCSAVSWPLPAAVTVQLSVDLQLRLSSCQLTAVCS